MTSTTLTIVGLVVTVLLALLAYLIRGLLAYSSVTVSLETRLSELSHKYDKTEAGVEEIRKTMLTPKDLDNAILKFQLQVMKETIVEMGGGRRATDKA